DLLRTSASAALATFSLRKPMPQCCSTFLSTLIRVSSAFAPRHQPSFAPVTIHACWYSQYLTFAFVGERWVANQPSRFFALAVSGISSSGSGFAPGTTKAGGRDDFVAGFGAGLGFA